MTGRILIAAAALGLGIAGAAAAVPHSKKAVHPKSAPASAAAQIVQNCDAHKFETVVTEMVDGQPHQSKVKLCGKDGQTDAEWIGTLKDAVAKLQANDQMPKPVRDQIVTALNTEIARIEIRGSAPLTGSQSASKDSVLDTISGLPPVLQSKPAEIAALPPVRKPASEAPAAEYAALPPLPTAPPPPTHVLAGGPGASTAALPEPRMTLTCYTPGAGAEGPCTDFTRETMLTVRADEDLPANTELRFVRDGDPKADVELAQLKRGRSMQFTVPGDVCRHVVGGKLELRVVRSGQEVGSDGPYNLSC